MEPLIPNQAYSIVCIKTARLKVSPANENWAQATIQPIRKNDVMYGTYLNARTNEHVFWIPEMNQFISVPRGMNELRVYTSCGVKREAMLR